jgi:hypothetical protein
MHIQIHFSGYSVLQRAEDERHEHVYCSSKSKVVGFAKLDREMGAPLKTAFLYTFSTHEAGEPS